MWKSFDEMEQLGWIDSKRPKMIVVQAEGWRSGGVRAFEQGAERTEFWQNASTISSGLRVPKPLGDFLILRAVRESSGTCIAIGDREALEPAPRRPVWTASSPPRKARPALRPSEDCSKADS